MPHQGECPNKDADEKSAGNDDQLRCGELGRHYFVRAENGKVDSQHEGDGETGEPQRVVEQKVRLICAVPGQSSIRDAAGSEDQPVESEERSTIRPPARANRWRAPE